ncbi:MAG: benzoate-CoA ligase family protein [Acidimicrobiales bacterium]
MSRRRAAAPAEPAVANLAVQLAERADVSGWADRVAFREGRRAWTHRQVHEGAARAAGALAGLGAGRGDRVLLALPDGIGFVWSFLGAARLGAVAVPVNPGLSAGEHAQMAEDAQPAVVVCHPGLVPRFEAVEKWRPVVVDGDALLRAMDAGSPAPPAQVGPDDPAYAQYTSGTTGRPKAALHRHSDPRCYYEAVAVGALGIGPDDVLLSVSKAYFAYGLGNTVFFPLFSGASAVLWPELPTVDGLVALVGACRPTVLFAVPSFYAALSARGGPRPFACLRAAVSAGEALSPALHERVAAWLGTPVLDGLGSTEVGQTFVSNTLGRARPGTVGVPLPGYRVSVRDEGGAELPPGETGELWVQGPSVLTGYWRRPDATEAALSGGWLRTGDRATVDRDGFVHHAGRVDDMEMVGGITVSPLEVEGLLMSHPAVVDVAVVAVPDDVGATRLRSFVVLAPGAAGTPQLEEELLDLVRSRHAPYKVPRSVAFVASLPRTPTGKLQRFALRGG